jgi:hypothetical protein
MMRIPVNGESADTIVITAVSKPGQATYIRPSVIPLERGWPTAAAAQDAEKAIKRSLRRTGYELTDTGAIEIPWIRGDRKTHYRLVDLVIKGVEHAAWGYAVLDRWFLTR